MFCVTFDFELQAAASNDAVLLSLGPQHSFPLEDVPAFLRSHNVESAVSQAVLRSPMFVARWRWNLNRSLAVLRRKGGRINPYNIQRMEAADLMAAVFPLLAACQDAAPAERWVDSTGRRGAARVGCRSVCFSHVRANCGSATGTAARSPRRFGHEWPVPIARRCGKGRR